MGGADILLQRADCSGMNGETGLREEKIQTKIKKDGSIPSI
jgi:hypothetical protein